MADPSVRATCGEVQPADPTAKPIDAAEAVLIPVEEELKKAAEKLEADISKTETTIHRFPERLRCLSKDGSYIVPSVVAIGPYSYHRRLPQLQKTEEVKKAAAYHFCINSGNSAEVYEKILSVSGDARSCYDDRDEAMGAGMDDAEFATMMFRDGCFLLQYIIFKTDGVVAPSLESWFLSNQTGVTRDIMLLENQLPWVVLDALMTFSSVPVGQFIANRGASFDVRHGERSSVPIISSMTDIALISKYMKRYKPPHLLGLLRFYQSNSKTSERVPDLPQEIPSVCFYQAESMTGEGLPDLPQGIKSVCFYQSESKTGEGVLDDLPQGITSVSQSSSAIELAAIGIKLIASKTTRFNDIRINISGPLYGKLFLAPLVMDDLNACYLVNMVALEQCTPYGADTVTSYILLLTMLMNREEDVHELRVKSILHSNFSDQETLDFIKNLVKLLYSVPYRHALLLVQLEAYKCKRWVWIAVHKFIYNNFKTIVTVLTVIGVLVGIFKTLLSLKQHQQ